MTPSEARLILGIDFGVVDTAELKRAFRAKAFVHHPDRGGSHDDFIELQRAYEFLLSIYENRSDRFATNRVWSPGRNGWMDFPSDEAIRQEWDNIDGLVRIARRLNEDAQDALMLRTANAFTNDWNARRRQEVRRMAERTEYYDSLFDYLTDQKKTK